MNKTTADGIGYQLLVLPKEKHWKKLVDPLVFEDTDDEDSAIFEIENGKDTPDPMEKQFDSVDVPETLEETDIDCDGLTIVEDEELWSDLPIFNSELNMKNEKKRSYFPSFFVKTGIPFKTNSPEQTPDNPNYGV